MLHYVHQLLANFACLLFAAEQVQWIYLNVCAEKKLHAGNEIDESGETEPKQ